MDPSQQATVPYDPLDSSLTSSLSPTLDYNSYDPLPPSSTTNQPLPSSQNNSSLESAAPHDEREHHSSSGTSGPQLLTATTISTSERSLESDNNSSLYLIEEAEEEHKKLIDYAEKRLFRAYSYNMELDGTRQSDHTILRQLKRNISDLSNTQSKHMRTEGNGLIPLRGLLDKKRRSHISRTMKMNMEELKKDLAKSSISQPSDTSQSSIVNSKTSDSSDLPSTVSTVSLSSVESTHQPEFSSSLESFDINSIKRYDSYENNTSSCSGDHSSLSVTSQSNHHHNNNNNNSNNNNNDDNNNNNNNNNDQSPSFTTTFSHHNSLHTNEFNSIQSTYPHQDDMTIQLLHRQASLQDESPMHDFANEISQRPSSTPNHATITSSFPENDQLIVNVLDNETYNNDYDDGHHTNNNNNNNSNNDDDWDETDDEDETESYYATRSPTHRHHQQRSLSQQSRQSQQEQLEEQSQRHSRRLKRKESCSSIYSTSSTHESRQRSSSTQNKFKPQVLFSSNITNDTKKKYTRFIRNSGGSIVYDWEKCTHLITNEFRNTINILCTYLSGKFVLSEEWIKDSISQSKFLDEEDYLLCQQPEINFFKRKRLYFTDSFINHANSIKEADRHQLARASSAKVIKQLPDDNDRENIIVVTMSTDDDDYQEYNMKNYFVLSKDQFLEKLKNQ